MYLNGFNSHDEYFDYVVSLMLNNDEDGIVFVRGVFGAVYSLKVPDVMDGFCCAVMKKINANNTLEAYSLLRKSIDFIHGDTDLKEVFKNKMLKEISVINKDGDSPLVKLLM